MARSGWKVFQSAWWSVELPPEWAATQHPECTTFQAEPPLGALQISAYRKEKGVVTKAELNGFADEQAPKDTCERPARYGQFEGSRIEFAKGGTRWRQWYLCSGRLMLFVTYNIAEGQSDEETQVVEAILSTLKPFLD